MNILVKIGVVSIAIALLVLVYNFFSMYSLATECPVDVDIQPCKAYDNWTMLNKIAPLAIVVGITMLVVGLFKRHQNNS